MAWFNNDGLNLKFGTEKTRVNSGGDYSMPGELRVAEFTIDLTTLTTSPVIQNDTWFYPANAFLEQVEIDTEVAATGGTSFSVGLIQNDRSTVTSNTYFVNGALLATHDALGEKTVLTAGSTGAGGGIGAAAQTVPNYVTALCAGTYTAGRVKVRIKYRGIGTITQ